MNSEYQTPHPDPPKLANVTKIRPKSESFLSSYPLIFFEFSLKYHISFLVNIRLSLKSSRVILLHFSRKWYLRLKCYLQVLIWNSYLVKTSGQLRYVADDVTRVHTASSIILQSQLVPLVMFVFTLWRV